MSIKDQELDHIKLHKEQPSDETQIVLEEPTHKAEAEVVVVVTQVFCHNGHNLVGRSPERFDGHPGISLLVRSGEQSGEVVVSPIHGDRRKRGITFPDKTKLTICCPECEEELPPLTGCRCSDGAKLRKLFLTPHLSEAHLVAVCDIWGCPLSRVIDSYTMFSEFVDGNIGD